MKAKVVIKKSNAIKRVNGAIVKGKKYDRTIDFSRDATGTLLRKAKKYKKHNEDIRTILTRRLKKLEAKPIKDKNLINDIKEFLK